MLARLILINTLFLLAVMAGLILCRWLWRKFRGRNGPLARIQKCRCGYPLQGLEIPRCPECGRMIGFDKTPEQLGISEADMRAFAEKRKSVPRLDRLP